MTRCTMKPAAASGRITMRTKNRVSRRCRDMGSFPILSVCLPRQTILMAPRFEEQSSTVHRDAKIPCMPVYEYACTSCGERTEARQSFDDPPLEECPHCGGRLRKLYSPVGIVFKGSGFYSTDRKSTKKTGKDDGKPPEDPKKSESKTETKAETSSGTSPSSETKSSS